VIDVRAQLELLLFSLYSRVMNARNIQVVGCGVFTESMPFRRHKCDPVYCTLKVVSSTAC
jgi:hypothetical protein